MAVAQFTDIRRWEQRLAARAQAAAQGGRSMSTWTEADRERLLSAPDLVPTERSQALLRMAEHRVRELLGQMDRQDLLDCRDAFARVPTQHNEAAWQRLNRKFSARTGGPTCRLSR